MGFYLKNGAIMNESNTINFLDQSTLDVINKNSSIKTLDAAIFAASQIDWNNNDKEARNALSWLIANAQKKALAKVKPMNCPFKLASIFMAKKDVRYYLQQIYSTGTHLVASNGHVLIKIYHACESGFYDAMGSKTYMEARYPEFDKMMANFHRDYQVALINDTLKFYDAKIKSYTYSDNHIFDAKYIDFLTKKLGLKHGYLCVNNNGGDDILFFESSNESKIQFVGCVMPLRVLKNDD